MESTPASDVLISLLPFAVFIAFLYFCLLRPLNRIGKGIDRLADLLERRGDEHRSV